MKLNLNYFILLIVVLISLFAVLLFINANSITGQTTVCPSGGLPGEAPLGNECCAENTCIPPDPDTGRGCSPQYTCASGLKCKFAPGMTFNGVCEKAPPGNATSPNPTYPLSLGELFVDFVAFQPVQVTDLTQDVLLGAYSLNFTGQNVQHPNINFTDFSFEFSGGVDLSSVRVFVDGVYYSGALANLPSTGGKHKFDLSPYTILLSVGQTRYITVFADVASLPAGVQSVQYTTNISNIASSKFTTKIGKIDSTITIIKSSQQLIAQQPPASQTQTQSGAQTATSGVSTGTAASTQTTTSQTIPSQQTTSQSTSQQQPATTQSTTAASAQPSSQITSSPAYPLSYGSSVIQQYSQFLPRHNFQKNALTSPSPSQGGAVKEPLGNTTAQTSLIAYLVVVIILFLSLLILIFVIYYLINSKQKRV